MKKDEKLTNAPTDWSAAEIKQFQNAIIQWFEEEGNHDLPWRQTRDPYAVLVSELMLQQTQVATVLNRGFFENWLEKFPDVETLAAADEDSILKAWEGLGYYNRARNLQKAAQIIMQDHSGVFPEDFQGILNLPGVGEYTAGAVYSCAFEKSAPVVDGNVIRVFSRLFAYMEPVDTTEGKKFMWDSAKETVPDKKAREFNSGLMELGQRICRKSNPSCLLCPVRAHCRAYKQQLSIEELPSKKTRQKIAAKTEHVGFLREGNRIYLTRESGNRRKGLWRLPEIKSASIAVIGSQKTLTTSYGITRYRVEMNVYSLSAENDAIIAQKGQWFTIHEGLEKCALAAPYRKAIETLLKGDD